MRIEVADKDLESLDRLDTDTLLLFLVQDEGPLSGLAGLVDWRLTGRLSRSLLRGWCRGEPGERLLMPTQGRLPTPRLMGIGIGGSPVSSADDVKALGEAAGRMLQEAKVASVACGLPGEPSVPSQTTVMAKALCEGLSRTFGGRVVLLGEQPLLRQAVGVSR